MSERKPPYNPEDAREFVVPKSLRPSSPEEIARKQDLTPTENPRPSDEKFDETMSFGDVRDRGVTRGPKLSLDDLPDVPIEDQVHNFSLAEVQKYNELQAITELFENEIPVAIRRSNGEEIQGNITSIDEKQGIVTVTFEGEDTSNVFNRLTRKKKMFQKKVPFKDFLSWQQ